MFAGQATVGGLLSATETRKVQLGVPPVFEQVTVVVPSGKVVPDAGVQVIVQSCPVGGV